MTACGTVTLALGIINVVGAIVVFLLARRVQRVAREVRRNAERATRLVRQRAGLQ